MTSKPRVLVCGAGIAGLTLGSLLKSRGYTPLVIDREPSLRTEGYMMDFFGSGWDVAERMGLVPALRAIRYPIDELQFVDDAGKPFITVPIDVVRRALRGRYVYLRRSDLERILYEHAVAAGVEVRFGASLAGIDLGPADVGVRFTDGSSARFSLLFGADGVHSEVRRLIFGAPEQFERFLGAYVAAFHLERHPFAIGRALKLHEEIDRVGAFYPLDARRADATYAFRHDEIYVSPEQRLDFMRREFEGAGWILARILDERKDNAPIFFDSMTQIVMPQWSKGRIALLGDACGCLTLLAGQGSHMAMAGAYILAHELERHDGNCEAAFAAYQSMLKPAINQRQRDAALLAKVFIPSTRSRPWLRHLTIRLIFNALVLPLVMRWFGARSVLERYG
jgi:2-polyprenyl-6-methoxyphenol hydroxylase-like FAD-dependent oxidoreductase